MMFKTRFSASQTLYKQYSADQRCMVACRDKVGSRVGTGLRVGKLVNLLAYIYLFLSHQL